jgi:hypothetical protein
MRRVKHPRGDYDQPERRSEHEFEYRGFDITWVRPPVPPWAGVEWSATRPGFEEEGSILSSLIENLQTEIDQYWAEQREENRDRLIKAERENVGFRR